MTTFQLVPAGPFSLGASAAFLEGFSPAAYRGAGDGHLHVAFVPDGEAEAAGVCLRQADRVGGGGGVRRSPPGRSGGPGGPDPVAGRRRDRVPRGGRAGPGGRRTAGALAGTAAGRVLLTVRGRRLGADRAPQPDRAGGPGQ